MVETAVGASIDLDLEPLAAFDAIVDELAAALDRLGIRFEPGVGRRLVEAGLEVGRVVTWQPGECIPRLPKPWPGIRPSR